MTSFLQVVDSSRFVVAQNKTHTSPKWWACPTVMSRKCKRLVATPGAGLAIYGVWCLLVSYMAGARYRWTLTDSEGNPVPLSELAWEWRVDEAEIAAAVAALVDAGWLRWTEGTGNLESTSRQAGDTDKTDETNVTGRNGRDAGGWLQAAVCLGLSGPSVESFRELVRQGVPPGRVEIALKDGVQRKAKIKNVERWAQGVRLNLAKECL